MPLSDAKIRTAKPAEKPYKLADERGLYLLVNPTGGRLWRFKYRVGGKEKLLALGSYPDVGLKDARERRDAARAQVAKGIDPSAARKAAKTAGADTFEAVAREWLSRNAATWIPTHAERIAHRLERDVFPWLGTRPVGSIDAPGVLAALRRVEARGAVETAHRVLQTCAQVFRYAVATGRAERDPTGDLRGALPPVRETHRAAITDPAQIGPLLRALDGYNGTLTVRCALRLAPLVFVRPGELRAAEWTDIDLCAADWRYTVSKTGTPHIVPLSTQAVEILRELHPATGRGRYVFPSARTDERPMSDNAILAALRRMGIAKEEMSGHGFRAMARTVLDEVLGFRPEWIEQQLAHAVRDPLGRAYNRTAHLPERRKMMQEWADYLDKLKAGAEIIPIYQSA
jgi:integrase